MKYTAIAMLSLGLLSASVYADDAPMTNSPNNTEIQAQTPADLSKKKGEAFLLANKLKPGVVTLPDGLQYKVLTEGKGDHPTDTDTVTVDYAGTLINGTEFDSSYKRGQSASFPVNGVIAGWTEALKMMRPGATWMIYIPSNLAYGEQGAPPNIGPNEALVFKVHLISVNK